MRKSIILSEYGYWIGKKGDLIIIRRKGEKREISVGNLGRIIAFSRGLSISGDAINLMLRHGIHLIFISRDRPIGRLQPFRRGVSIKLKKEQVYAQLDNRAMSIAKNIVLSKIANQIELLRQLRRSRLKRQLEKSRQVFELYNKMKSIYNEVKNLDLEQSSYRKDLLLMEAEASRLYWSGISLILPEEVGFDYRRKRFENPRDPFNLSLNYLYTLLASRIWTAVELSGLDPWLGYFHIDNNRRPSLVMDLMEEFRQPIVDKPLLLYFLSYKNDYMKMVAEDGKLSNWLIKELSKMFFSRLKDVCTFKNRTLTIDGHIHLQPRRLAKFILGKEPEYIPFNVL